MELKNDLRGGYVYPGSEAYIDLSAGSSVRIRAPKLKPEFPGPKFFRIGTSVYALKDKLQRDNELVFHASFGTEQGAKDFVAGDKS